MAKILIVEDDKFLLNIFVTTFEKENFEVKTASDAKTGFGIVKNENPSIVLLDIMLPGDMDGLGFLKEVKKDSKISHIPIIILSNLEDDKTISEGLKLGASGYFIKSQAEPDDVVRNVKTLIR